MSKYSTQENTIKCRLRMARRKAADPVAYAKKMKERARSYRERHPEQVRAAQARSNKKWAAVIRESQRHKARWVKAGRIWWVITHPKECQDFVDRVIERKRRERRNRKARQRGAVGRMSMGLYARLFALQQGKCAVCRSKGEKMDMDHIIPLAGGGSNEDSNIQLLCKTCNNQKSAKHPVEFMQSRGFLL